MPTYLALSVLGFLVIVLNVIEQSRARALVSDTGPIQQLTAMVLFAGCLMCLERVLRKIPPVFKWAELSYLLLIYTMREMDFHRLFTEEHLTRTDFYLGPYPLYQKLIAVPIVLLAIIAALHFLLSNARFFFEQLMKKQSWAIHVVAWAVLLFGAQMLEKTPWRGLFLQIVVEEAMELAAAIMIFLILTKYPISKSLISGDAQPVADESE